MSTGARYGRRRPRSLGLALAVSLGMLAGCTTSIEGTPSPAEQGADGGGAPAPSADPTPAPEVGRGTNAEAHRIAGVTVAPRVVFPDLDNVCLPTLPITRVEATESLIFAPGTAASILSTYGFVAGFASCANQTDGPRAAISFVAEMSDPDSSIVAAAELAESFAEINGSEPVEVPGFEELPAVESVEVEGGEDVVTIEVLQPVGRMLAYFYYTDADPEQARQDLGEMLEEQRDLLEGFEPTPQDEIADLDPDPLDLERRTAVPPGDSLVYTGTYDLQGFLHRSINPEVTADLLPANGFEGVYLRETYDDATSSGYVSLTYQFGSQEESDAVFADFTRIEQEEFADRVVFTLPDDATIPCFYIPAEEPGGFVYQRCYTRVGQYLGSTDASAVADPADISVIRALVLEQIAGMTAP